MSENIIEDIAKQIKPKKLSTKKIEYFQAINENVSIPIKPTYNNVYDLKSYFVDGEYLECALSDNTLVNRKVDNINDKLSIIINSGERVLINTGLEFYPNGSTYFAKSVPGLLFDYNITSDIILENTIWVVLVNDSNGRVRITNDMLICELVILEKKENE